MHNAVFLLTHHILLIKVIMKQERVPEEKPVQFSTAYVPYSEDKVKLRLRSIPKN
jgi:hypothetical protein